MLLLSENIGLVPEQVLNDYQGDWRWKEEGQTELWNNIQLFWLFLEIYTNMGLIDTILLTYNINYVKMPC